MRYVPHEALAAVGNLGKNQGAYLDDLACEGVLVREVKGSELVVGCVVWMPVVGWHPLVNETIVSYYRGNFGLASFLVRIDA